MEKYFKIVNPEGHHGLVYKEGYNIDPLSFKPYGDCEDGGIYIAKEDILVFLGYGSDVYECEPIGKIYENPASPKKYKVHELNMKYIGKWADTKVLDYLIKQGADIHADDDYVLFHAAMNGYLNAVKCLVEHGADIHANDDDALRWAAGYGHLDIVKYLVEKGADIHSQNDFALRWAARNGYFEIIKYLAEHGADIHAYDDYALRYAAMNGHLETVKYLVEQGADIHANNDYALRLATEYGHSNVVKYLKSLK